MEQKMEALYLINGDKFLHLRENGAGVGFATYDCANGAPLESGQISKQNLPPDGRNAIPAARNWYLFEISSDDRKAIQKVSLQHLDTIPQSGVRRRRIWDDPTIPRDDIRLINSHYDDLYRVPNHGVIGNGSKTPWFVSEKSVRGSQPSDRAVGIGVPAPVSECKIVGCKA